MSKYEAMFIVKPDLPEKEREALFGQISDTVTKRDGSVLSADVWAEKRKLSYPVEKHQQGTYYLMSFEINPLSIQDIRHTYKMNEDILRVLITGVE